MNRIFGACLLAAASPSTASAEVMTFEQAIGKASAGAPLIAAARLRTSAARSSAQAAGALPDPAVSLSLENFPVSGPPAFSLDEDEMTMVRVGVEQPLPNAAKRHAARTVARAQIDVADAEGGQRARQVRLGAALAWIDLAYAERKLSAIARVLADLRPLQGAVNAGVTAGSARPAETLSVAEAIARLEDRQDGFEADAARARAELGRWTGDPAPDVIGEPPTLSFDPAALRASLASHPVLVSADASTRLAEANVATARAEKRPDFGVQLAYGRRDDRYGDMVSAGVRVSLPLFARTRQDPLIAARADEAAQALLERQNAERTLAAELEGGLADHVMHHEQWMRARETLLPLARQRVQLEAASYGAGRATLVDAVDAQSLLADAELVALEREAEVARDAVRLTIGFGRDPQ